MDKLSRKLAEKWGTLGRRLGFDQAAIKDFCQNNGILQDKAFSMLMDWKLNKGEDATYIVLYDALCHELAGCKLLAEEFCCDL